MLLLRALLAIFMFFTALTVAHADPPVIVTVFTPFPQLDHYSTDDGLLLRVSTVAEFKFGEESAIEYRQNSHFVDHHGQDIPRDTVGNPAAMAQDAVYIYLPAKRDILEKAIDVFSQGQQGIDERKFGLAIRGAVTRTNIRRIYMDEHLDDAPNTTSPHLEIDKSQGYPMAFIRFGEEVKVETVSYKIASEKEMCKKELKTRFKVIQGGKK